MTFKRRNYCVGGSSSTLIRPMLTAEASWFRTECLRMVDDVMMILDYLPKSTEANRILNHILDFHAVSNLPEPFIHWKKIQIEPLRIYYLIKESMKRGDDMAN